MTDRMITRILEKIAKLQGRTGELDPLEYLEELEAILHDLLPARGLYVYSQEFDNDPPIPPEFDAILLPKSDAAPIPVRFEWSDELTAEESVNQLIAATAEGGYTECMLITRNGWRTSAHTAAKAYDPNSVHLLDLEALEMWARNPGLLTVGLDDRARVISRVAGHSKGLALDIASRPKILDEIEWRELEKVINEVLAGLGYSVRLTPPSKDGGKDIVVRCLNVSTTERYYLEIKHWRSGIAPGSGVVKSFAKVLTRDKVRKGLVLSSSGFTQNVMADLSAVEMELVALAGKEKIFSLCLHYKLIKAGKSAAPTNPAELLFENTTSPLLLATANRTS